MDAIRTIHIGEEIKKRFDASGLTQKEFGAKIGMPQQNVSRVFNASSIDTNRLAKVCVALKFNFFALYCEDNTMKTEGDFSPLSKEGDVSVVVGDAILAERVKSLEILVNEKTERINELKERIEELKKK